MKSLSSVLLMISAFGPAAAYAQGEGMWTFAVGNMCLLQDPKYQTSNLGRFYSSSPNFAGWNAIESTARAKCFRSKQWVSEQLCSDVLEVVFAKKDFPPDYLETLRKKHSDEIHGLQEAFNYFAETLGRSEKVNTVPCPGEPKPSPSVSRDKATE